MSVDVSVIITSYNVERYIERAINSVLAQQKVTFEVVVVDDNSTDTTWNIVSAIQDQRLQIVRLTENQGPGAARNAGIAKASGKWIAVLDGDDSFEPDRLRKCINRGQTFKADIVVDNLIIQREADGITLPMFPPARFAHMNILTLPVFIRKNASFLGGYTLGYLKPIILRSFLEKHHLSYDASLRIGEDYIFLAEALAYGARCAVEHSLGYNYTVRAHSISHRMALSDVNRIAGADERFTQKHSLSGDAAKAQEKRANALKEAYAFTVMMDALKQKRIIEAGKAFWTYPLALRNIWMPIWARLHKVIKRHA